MKHTLSVLVEDESGALSRISGLFARRGFNIDKELIDIVRKPVLRKTAARSLRAMCIGMSTRGHKLKASYLLKQISTTKKVPFLLLWGEKDNFIPLFLGKKIANFHRWVELKIISNSGHCVPVSYTHLTLPTKRIV